MANLAEENYLWLSNILDEDGDFNFKLPRKICVASLRLLLENRSEEIDSDIESFLGYQSLIFDLNGLRVKSRIEKIGFCESSSLDSYYCIFSRKKTSHPLCLIALTFPEKNEYGNDTVCLHINNRSFVNDNKKIAFITPQNYEVKESSFVSFRVNIKNFDSQLVDKISCYKAYNEVVKSKLENPVKFEYNFVDIDLFGNNFDEFCSISPEDGRVIVPITSGVRKLKNLCVKFRKEKIDNDISSKRMDDKSEFEQSFEGFSFCGLSDEHIKIYIKKLEEKEIFLQKGTTLGAIDIEIASETHQFEKLIRERGIKDVQFVEDKKGEITRVNRIIKGFSNCLSHEGQVQNSRLVELVCENKIPTEFTKYTPDKQRIKSLHKEYPLLNEGQTTAIDKILQMENNNQDILLIQGPPGTGKTELILSLIKEFTKNRTQALITSNVQIACNNISQRIKNDKEIILKRYSYYKDKNGKEDEEHLKNQQNYITNQVLGYFEVNNKPITNFEELSKAKKELEQLKIKLESLNKEYAERSLPFVEYYQLKQKDENLIMQISSFRENLKVEFGNFFDSIENEFDFYSEHLKNLTTQRDQISKQIDESNEKIANFMRLNNRLNDEISKNFDEINEIKSQLDNQEETNLAFSKKKESESKKIESLRLLQNEDVLRNWVNEIKQLAIANTLLKSKNAIFNSCIDFINQKILLRRLLMKDSYLEQGEKNIETSTLEKLQKNTITKNNEELLDKIACVLGYENKTELEKIFINLALWGERVKERKNVKKSIGYIIDYAENYLEDDLFEYFITKDVENCINIDYVQKWLTEYEENLQSIQKEQENYIKNCENLKTIQISKGECIKKNRTDIKNNSIEIGKIEVIIRENEGKLEKINNVLVRINEFLSLEQAELECSQKIKDFVSNNSKELQNFELFKTKFTIEERDLESKVNKNTIEIQNIENSINLLVSNTQSRDEAALLMFDYIRQLESIKSANFLDSKRLLDGRGDEFDEIFRLGNTRYGGEIISMTTNQIARLFRDDNFIFDYVIVDEASKCSIEDLIVSLSHAKRLVLIGDYMQLAPIPMEYCELTEEEQNAMPEELWKEYNVSTFSNLLEKFLSYNEKNNISSFEENPMVAVLKTQYRMNRGIYKLIEPIYSIHKELAIEDGKGLETNDLMCLNVSDSSEMKKDGSNSFYNDDEASIINDVLTCISQNREKFKNIKTIGVISGYADQIQKINRNLIKSGVEKIKGFEIGSVDRFQGREYDLVIVSLVRTKALGFLRNVRRMNVALSRAKSHLLVIGNFDKLSNVAPQVEPIEADNIGEKNEHNYVKEELIPQLRKISKRFMSKEVFLKDFEDFITE